MPNRRVGLFLAMILVSLVFAGCEAKEDYELCHLTPLMLSDCGVPQGTVTQEMYSTGLCEDDLCVIPTCMVLEHPQCLDGPCLLYREKVAETGEIRTVPEPIENCEGQDCTYDQKGFCSMPCDTAEDCPGTADCINVLGQGYCVPR